MPITRREFVRGGVAAFTISFAAPAFLSDLARAQGRARRNLVVLYLSGGNDSLSMLIPYNDPEYRNRRPTIGIPAANVLQIGSDRAGVALGLHPRLTGLRTIFNAGRLAFIQRTGYQNSSRSHFEGTDIWSTGDPRSPQSNGWLGAMAYDDARHELNAMTPIEMGRVFENRTTNSPTGNPGAVAVPGGKAPAGGPAR